MVLDERQMAETVRQVIADALKLPVERVTLDAYLIEDLGAESLDFVEIAFKLEKAFGVGILKDNIMEKAIEVIGEGVLEKSGRLTSVGVRMVRHRMPEVDPSKVIEGMHVEDLNGLFTVGTWVRVVREVLEAMPEKCPVCGAPELESIKPMVLKCKTCGGEVPAPSGDDVARQWIESAYAEIVKG